MLHANNYRKIAAILAGDFASATPQGKQALFCTTLSLADYFKRDNPNFNRSAFYLAVFGTSDTGKVHASFMAERPYHRYETA